MCSLKKLYLLAYNALIASIQLPHENLSFMLVDNFGLEHTYHITARSSNLLHLALTVLVATTDAQWEGIVDVGSARYEPALLPPMPDHKGFKLQ